MTNPSAKQPRAPYPSNFLLAVKPEEVAVSKCRHEDDPPVCYCVHDWRIEWANVEREDL